MLTLEFCYRRDPWHRWVRCWETRYVWNTSMILLTAKCLTLSSLPELRTRPPWDDWPRRAESGMELGLCVDLQCPPLLHWKQVLSILCTIRTYVQSSVFSWQHYLHCLHSLTVQVTDEVTDMLVSLNFETWRMWICAEWSALAVHIGQQHQNCNIVKLISITLKLCMMLVPFFYQFKKWFDDIDLISFDDFNAVLMS